MPLRSRRAKCWRGALLPLRRAEVQRQNSHVFPSAKQRQPMSLTAAGRDVENAPQEGESGNFTRRERPHGSKTPSQTNVHWPASSIHRSSSRSRTGCTCTDHGQPPRGQALVNQNNKHRVQNYRSPAGTRTFWTMANWNVFSPILMQMLLHIKAQY